MLSLDPIERLNLYMVMWENWVRQYKLYTYHGIKMRCYDKFLFFPFYEGTLLEKIPPLYHQFSYTGDETFGWSSVWFSLLSDTMLVLSPGLVRFCTWGTRQNKDTVTMRVTNPKCDGSMLMNWSLIDLGCGAEKPDISHQNQCASSTRFDSPLWSLAIYYAKYGWYKPPPYIDYWAWSDYPSIWSCSYILNWRYYPISGVYDLWDNKYQKMKKTTTTTFDLKNRATYSLVTRDYPGTCFRQLGVDITDISFYSDVWFPMS